MYVQFYNKNTGRQESAFEVRRSTGLDPETVGPAALETVGIFPISYDQQPYNTLLYDISVSWDTSTGYGVKSWTATGKTVADVVKSAKKLRQKTVSKRVKLLRRASKLESGLLDISDGIDDTVRPARFDNWVDRINQAITQLDSELTTIEGATTIDQINNIVSAADGGIRLALDSANPLNLLAGDFGKFYSVNYTKSDLELYFPSTNTTLAYNSGFPATSSVVTSDDATVQIRVASTGVVIDELELSTRSSSSDLPNIAFGFRVHRGESYDSTEFNEYQVTVSGGKFLIDGESQYSLKLYQGEYYRFIQEDSSNAGHPLKIYTNAEKEEEVVARVVTVGTPGSAGAYTEYVPGKAGIYSYQCGSHSEMGGTLYVVDTYGRDPSVPPENHAAGAPTPYT